MSLYDFTDNELRKLNDFMLDIQTDEPDKEKIELYFNQWCFENTKTENSYYDATSLSLEHREIPFE